jgi:hypothetical protein
MAVAVVGDFTSETIWYDLPIASEVYAYNIIGLGNKDLAVVKAYSKLGTTTPIISGTFINAGGSFIGTFTTVDTDTGSTANYSEVQVAVPSGTVKISMTTNSAAFASIEYLKLSLAPTLTPAKYTTSGNIAVPNGATVTLLGGGGGGGGWGGGNTWKFGGGGSGYLTNGSVTAGVYALTIGAPGAGSGGGTGGTGGTTTFSTFSASGGTGGGNGFGGGGGSNGGSPGSNGGFNGTPGSGVVPTLFTSVAADAGIAGQYATGGGVYGGGGGGTGNSAGSAGSANGSGGGGGGGNASYGGGSGGNGAAGALYVLAL